jgi:hypothetical protein
LRKIYGTILVRRNFDPDSLYFEKIYLNRLFGESESASGAGSSLDSTIEIRKNIMQIFDDYGINSIADVPCGDLFWFSTLDTSKLNYTGLDIVPALISELKQRYPKRQFKIHDATSDSLGPYDLILCRDLFVHLTNKQISQSLALFKKSGSTYLLTTTFVDRKRNPELHVPKVGVGWRPINLSEAPFYLGKPIRVINENCLEGHGKFRDKSLGLWRLN